MLIPETFRNQDWPRRVARQVNRMASALNNNTGWEYHLNPTGTIAITANTRTQITLTPTLSITDQSPDGIDLFAGNEVFGELNDVIITRLTADFTPSDAAASIATVEIEADVLGVIDRTSIPVISGAGVAERISWLPMIFIGSPDVAGGVRFYITVDGAGTLDNVGLLPVRVHKGNMAF